MPKTDNTQFLSGKKKEITKEDLQERIESKLINKGVLYPKQATEFQLYQATVQAIKDIMIEYRNFNLCSNCTVSFLLPKIVGRKESIIATKIKLVILLLCKVIK